MNDLMVLGREQSLYSVALLRERQKVQETINGREFVITGGAGSLGTALCLRLLRLGASKVTSIDLDENRTSFLLRRAKFDPRLEAIVTDVRDSHEYMVGKTVFHLAARKHVRLSDAVRYDVASVNFYGTQVVLDAADKVIFASTDKACDPSVWYGMSKRAAEELVLDKDQTAIRLCNMLFSNGSLTSLALEDFRAGRQVQVPSGVIRHFITLEEGVDSLLLVLILGRGLYVTHLDRVTSLSMEQVVRSVGSALGITKADLEITEQPEGEKPVESCVGYLDGYSAEISHGLLQVARDSAKWPRIQSEIMDPILSTLYSSK